MKLKKVGDDLKVNVAHQAAYYKRNTKTEVERTHYNEFMVFKRDTEIFEKRFLVGDLFSIKAIVLGNNHQNDNGD